MVLKKELFNSKTHLLNTIALDTIKDFIYNSFIYFIIWIYVEGIAKFSFN